MSSVETCSSVFEVCVGYYIRSSCNWRHLVIRCVVISSKTCDRDCDCLFDIIITVNHSYIAEPNIPGCLSVCMQCHCDGCGAQLPHSRWILSVLQTNVDQRAYLHRSVTYLSTYTDAEKRWSLDRDLSQARVGQKLACSDLPWGLQFLSFLQVFWFTVVLVMRIWRCFDHLHLLQSVHLTISQRRLYAQVLMYPLNSEL